MFIMIFLREGKYEKITLIICVVICIVLLSACKKTSSSEDGYVFQSMYVVRTEEVAYNSLMEETSTRFKIGEEVTLNFEFTQPEDGMLIGILTV